MVCVLALAVLVCAGLLVAQAKDPSQINVSTIGTLIGQGQGFCGAGGPIPDLATVQFVINIPGSFTLNDVNVSTTLNHTFISDLEMRVEHGPTVLLYDNECGSEDGIDILFDDEAGIQIGLNCANPYIGTFIPVQPLSAFDGSDAQGNWTLSITDNVGADEGFLNQWCVVTDPVAVELQEFTIN
jgi:subtilisin-like proprotein convertase family protein